MHFSSIESMIKDFLKGKLKDAVIAWVNNPSFDKDTEITMLAYIDRVPNFTKSTFWSHITNKANYAILKTFCHHFGHIIY